MSKYRRLLKYFTIAIVLFIALIFLLQIIVVPLMGGVGGSFGLRPHTHRCLGFPIKSKLVGWLPDNDIELNIFLHFRYQVSSEIADRNYCLGQDIWFGE